MRENDKMAKKRTVKKAARKPKLASFDVYEQADGALVVLAAGEEPELDLEPVWSGEAKDERDAIRQTRKSNKHYRKAPAAEPMHDPDTPDSVRQQAETATNKRLGITTRSAKKRSGRKKSTAKSGAKKVTRSYKRKSGSRKK
jgi:hypothetical protein